MDMVYLYVLVRNDLASMPPGGKAAAQACHAANQCMREIDPGDVRLNALRDEWEGQTGKGFGTTITLHASPYHMRKAVEYAREAGVHAGITHDPTYPLVDGDFVHLIPLDTCAYVFGRKNEVMPFVHSFPLMP